MPIYEYECTKCGHQAEVWQKMTEAPMTRCDHCKGKMRKLISQSTFILLYLSIIENTSHEIALCHYESRHFKKLQPL